jgi:hypothetical protein
MGVNEQPESEPDLPPALREPVDHRYRNFAGRGWWPLLEEMHERLLTIDPPYRLCQVKEKWGVLRVYVEDKHYVDRPDVLDQIKAVVGEAVGESAVTCERCGEPGRLRNDEEWLSQRHYLLTLCDRCVPIELVEWREGVQAFIAEFIEGEGATQASS